MRGMNVSGEIFTWLATMADFRLSTEHNDVRDGSMLLKKSTSRELRSLLGLLTGTLVSFGHPSRRDA